jgi:hypothetical protein
MGGNLSIRFWYYKHFNRAKLLEELSKPADGDYVAVTEGNMVTRVRRDELEEYMRYVKERDQKHEVAQILEVKQPKH